ncbi:hypothetical protein FQN55_001292 [Onygenales sp. PD_40]|nr:hypothetical protein FQN55_001292 [Onygenales sp. PD_40]
MSKRGAQSQGGKDIGFGPDMSSESTPQRATAAQLASRKIKQARQRTRVGSPNPAPTSQSFSNPFTSIDPNIVPPNPGANGFSFGQSQSFPPPSPSVGAQNTQSSLSFTGGDQNNSGFKFSQLNTTSTPFSFSASSGPSQEVKNPFASMPSGFGQSQPTSFNLQSPSFNFSGAPNQDGQNKPAQPVNFFGASQPQQSQAPFSFSSNTPSTSASPFSPAPATATPATSTPFSQSSSNNVFAPSTPSTNIFGMANKSSDEMQTSPDNSNGTGVAKPNPFNVSAISQPAFTASAPAKTSSPFTFSSPAPATSSASQPFSTPASSAAPFSGSNLFGNLKKPDETPKPTESTAPFSTPTFSAAPFSGSNLFGNLKKPDETSKPTESAAPTSAITQPSPKFSVTPSILSGSSIFGQGSKPEEQTGKPAVSTTAPPFSTSFTAPPTTSSFSLFGVPKPSEPAPATSATADKPSTSQAAAPPATTTPFSLFGIPKPAEPSADTSKISAPSTSNAPEPSTTAGTSLFGRIPKPDEAPSTSAPSSEKENALSKPSESPSTSAASAFPSTPSGGSLFGLNAKPTGTNQTNSVFNTPTAETATSKAPAFSFSSSSNNIFQSPNKTGVTTGGAEEKTKEGGQSTANLFKAMAAAKATPDSTPKSLFGSVSQTPPPTSKPSASTPSAAEKAPATPVPASTPFAQSFTPTQTPKLTFSGMPKAPGNVPVSTPSSVAKKPLTPRTRLASFGPPNIPRDLNNDQRAEFDTEWRITALNKSFKQKLAETDPESDEIDSLIEFYIIMRQNIGAPTRMSVSKNAATKRQAGQNDRVPEESPSKRAKPTPSVPGYQTYGGNASDVAPSSSSLGSLSGEKSATLFSALSPPGKRKATEFEDGASPSNQSGKRSKFGIGSANQSEKTDETKSDITAASDTVTMFASSFVSQSQGGNPPPFLAAPSSETSQSPAKDATDNNSGSDSGSDSGHGSEGTNASAADTESESSPTPPAGSASGGRSLFDRVELDQSGNPVRQEVVEDKEKTAEPAGADKDTGVSSLFAGSKFASSFNSPASTPPQFSTNGFDFRSPRSVSPANPGAENKDAKSPPSTIFPPSTGNSTPSASAPFSFLQKPGSSLQPNGTSPFSFSAATSADVSRATTPALSDTPAEETEERAEDLPQADLMRGAGEENEEEVHEVRCKAMKYLPAQSEDTPEKWHTQGVGLLRILKNKDTSRCRMLLRAEPSGRVILNSNLSAHVTYKPNKANVQFLVALPGKTEMWLVRVKTEPEATKLAAVMNEMKKN